MNVVDSSGWLEYFADSENAAFFAPAIEDAENLLVPAICIYDVYKRVLQQGGLGVALTRISDLHTGRIIPVDAALAMSAAQISADMKLPMADSLILAAARAHNATLWTQDEHFRGMEGVRFIAKQT